jgi:hypothetical protein
MRTLLTSASYTAQSLKASAQRCVNLYPESNPPDAAAPVTFYGTPGLRLHSTMPGVGPVRCLFKASNGNLYGAQGRTLYRYRDGAWHNLATLATASGPVHAADNGLFAVFVDGSTNAPTVDLGGDKVSSMGGEGWYGADFVAYVDTYLVFNKPNSQAFYITGQLDLSLDALDFASAESFPDNVVSLLVDHREIWLFGEQTTEVFSDAGAADFPFERVNGTIMQQGCIAPHSPTRFDNSIVWLGGNDDGSGIVWRANGYTPTRISTHALENELRGYPTLADAQGFSYQQNGHTFYVLTFPTAGKTWCYDAAVNQWHERAYRQDDGTLTRNRANCHVFYGGQHLVGDFENGNVYVLDPETYTDNGAEILRTKSFQHMVSDGKRQFFRSFELDMETGVGNDDDPDPQVWLRWSDDGGHTWSATVTMSMGKLGEYARRMNRNRLGMGRDRVFEVSTTAKTKVVLQGAFIDAVPGAA